MTTVTQPLLPGMAAAAPKKTRRKPKAVAPVIDPLCVDKAVDRYRPGSRKLGDTAALFGVDLGEDAHDADADVDAAGLLTHRMWLRSQLPTAELRALCADRRYPDRIARDWVALGRMSLGELHAAQAGWFREQSESFAQYLRRESGEKQREAQRAEEEFGLGDEGAATARREAEELLARADSVSSEWPLRPVVAS